MTFMQPDPALHFWLQSAVVRFLWQWRLDLPGPDSTVSKDPV